MREYALVLLIAAAITYLLSGLCRRLALRVGAVAKVRDRDIHVVPIPYFGGLAMLGGLFVAFTLAAELPFLGRHAVVGHDARGVVIAGVVICAIGVLDDIIDLPAIAKFAGQALAAGIVVLNGVRIFWIPLPNSIISLDPVTSILITALFIMICSNAVNFADGLDGLAAGIIAIGSGAFFVYTYVLAYEQDLVLATTASLIAVATCGVCLGFLPHNFHPAKMFMGDTGAMLLGLLMATSAISLTGQFDPSALTATAGDLLPALLPIILPFAILLLPLLDLLFAVFRRTYNGQWWFIADRGHLHHQLLDRGFGQQGAVLLLYGWSAVVSFGLVIAGLTHSPVAWVICGLGIVALAAITIRGGGGQRPLKA